MEEIIKLQSDSFEMVMKMQEEQRKIMLAQEQINEYQQQINKNLARIEELKNADSTTAK